MSDLISREELMKLWDEYHPYIATRAIQFDQAIRKLPPAYPKKGKWIPTCEFHGFNNEVRNKAIACSVCNVAFRLRDYSLMEDYRYCPNCGADMRGEK